MVKRLRIKPRFNFKHKVVPIPEVGSRSEKAALYGSIIDKLLTLETHQAMKLDYKEFVGKAVSLSLALRKAARAKKIEISTMVNDDHVTVWRKVQV